MEAAAAYLAHMRDAWNHAVAGKNAADRLERQDVILTVPASFDAVARELTVEAARASGLANVTLLEEPQAAFYAWLSSQGDQWRKRVKVGDLLLVCDVGGGTTDFTLIAVTDQDGDLSLTRLAVGEHILLGGDNMDLALAHAVAATLPNGMDGLDPAQRVALGHSCRVAKETLFNAPGKASAPVAILGRGSKVIGGSLKTELTRETLNTVLLDGFFPRCEPTDVPSRRHPDRPDRRSRPALRDRPGDHPSPGPVPRSAGWLTTLGRIVAHAFGHPLQRRRLQGRRAEEPRRRGAHLLGRTAGPESGNGRPRPRRRAGRDLLRPGPSGGKGICIRGQGCPGRALRGGRYLGARPSRGSSRQSSALCVVKMGMEEGTQADVPGPEFGLVVGEPAEFRFLGSTTRRDDVPGVILDRWSPEELQELNHLETALVLEDGATEGDTVPVRLHANVTEVGTLELWCQSTRDDRRCW